MLSLILLIYLIGCIVSFSLNILFYHLYFVADVRYRISPCIDHTFCDSFLDIFYLKENNKLVFTSFFLSWIGIIWGIYNYIYNTKQLKDEIKRNKGL